MYAVAREEVALTLASLDRHGREVEVHDHLLQARTRTEIYLQHLGLTVRVDRHVEYLALGRTLRKVILPLARDALDGAALHHDRAAAAVTVQHVVYRAFVVALEHSDIIDTLVEEILVLDLSHLVPAVLEYHYYVVYVAAVAYKLRILHALAYAEEALGPVDIEFGVRNGHLRRLDGIETADLGTTLTPLAVLVAYMLIVGNGIIRKVRQIVFRRLDIILYAADLVVGLVGIVTRYADELQLRQALHILQRNLAAQQLLEGVQALVHGRVGLFMRTAPLDELIELVLDEDTLQRGRMPRLVQLVKAYFKLTAQQTPRILGRAAENLLHTHEVRLLVTDNARIGRDGYLARGEGVEGVDGLVARLVVRNVDHDLDLVGRQIVHLLDTYLAPLVGLHDRILYRLRGRGKGYLRNGERPFVDLRDTRPHLDRATAQAVVVARHIHDTARREIGIQLEILPAKVCDTCIDQLVEVMRQDLGRQTYGNTVGALRQQQRELDRKCHGLLVAAVV